MKSKALRAKTDQQGKEPGSGHVLASANLQFPLGFACCCLVGINHPTLTLPPNLQA